MDSNKLISIIVPVYKAEKFLGQCLSSLKNQTYKNLEIILIDDGSPDSSGEICDLYAQADSRFKVIHQENAGVCAARNAGLAIATGEYFGFVDPDDWASSDMFEYLATKLEQYDADIVSCPYYRVIPNQETTSRTDGLEYVYTPEQAVEELVNRFVLRNIFWNKLFRRKIFEGELFPVDRIYEGTAMVYKLFEKANKVVQLGEPKYYYRDNPTSYINTETLKNSMDYVVAHINRYNDIHEKYPNIEDKLFQDTVKGILKLSYVGFRSSAKEIEALSEDIKLMRDFISKNGDKLELFFSKSEVKEVRKICLATKRSFQRARFIRVIRSRVEMLLQIVTISVLAKYFKKGTPKRGKKPKAPEVFDEVQQDKLDRLHKAEICILDEIDRICKKNGLKYYLYGGTLLGAIRHKGFIPWDDDMDLVMMREDYEKFAEACKKDLDPKFFYQTCFTDPEYPMLFAKIRMNDTYICEKKWKHTKLHSGIYVDILPLDRFPKGKLLKKFFLRYISILHQVCAFKVCHSTNPLGKLYYKLHRRLPKKFNYKIRDRVLKLCNAIGSKELVCSFGSHYQPMDRRILRSEWFEGERKTMQFGEKEYPVPSHWEGYILHLFGESYMELPPEDDRVCHADIESIILCDEDKELNEKRRILRLSRPNDTAYGSMETDSEDEDFDNANTN